MFHHRASCIKLCVYLYLLSISYAYDAPRRASETGAKIISRKEWRTLRQDLDKRSYDRYKKDMAQQEGNDVENAEGGFQRSYIPPDLDDEAEVYMEVFPCLVEQLFENLDNIKERGIRFVP